MNIFFSYSVPYNQLSPRLNITTSQAGRKDAFYLIYVKKIDMKISMAGDEEAVRILCYESGLRDSGNCPQLRLNTRSTKKN